MASSTPQQSQGQDDGEQKQSRRLGDDRAPYQEDPSDHEQGKKNSRQRGPPRRHHKNPPRQRRTHSNDYYFNYPTDGHTNANAPLYGPDPPSYETYSPNTAPYQQDASPWYHQPNFQTPSPYPVNYSGSYSYPSDPYSYFPGTPSMTAPYSQLRPYDRRPSNQPPMAHEEEYIQADAYESSAPPSVPPYPKYPSFAPRRPPPQPLVPKQPDSSPEYVMRGALGDMPERLSKKSPSGRRRDSASSSNEQRTLLVMNQVLEGLNNLRIRLEDKNSEVRSDPGRFWPGYQPGSVATSQYTVDETRSLDVERQERDHLVGIINRLLEERERQGYRNPYPHSQRRDITALIEDSLGLNESELNRALIKHSDSKEIESKLDTILDLLIERRTNNSQISRPLLQEYHPHRQDRHASRGDQTVISITSSREPNMRRQVLQRRATVAQPLTRERQYVQRGIENSSNQARVRRGYSKPMRPEEEGGPYEEPEEEYDLFQGYETQDSPIQEDLRTRRLNLARDMEDDMVRSEVVSEQYGSSSRGVSRRLSEGGGQRMRPRYFATVEDGDDDEEDQVPIPTRSSMAQRSKAEQGGKTAPPVPDPPLPVTGQRRKGTRVRFDND
ncbi:hypothetical protein ACLX1H_000825 [Fusarium chlamydosporum]